MKLRTGYSPFDMCNEAIRLIKLCSDTQISQQNELQIILLLNKADSFSDMSKYQLSMARKRFADLYYKNGITGNTLEQYSSALRLNPNLSVRRIKELNKIPKPDLIFSLDANISDEPDYSNLEYHTIEVNDDFHQRPEERKKHIAFCLGITVEELEHIETETRATLCQKAQKENEIYDPEFEQMIKNRLEKLGEPYISTFYRTRAERDEDDTLSNKEFDLLTLKSMEHSYNYRKD